MEVRSGVSKGGSRAGAAVSGRGIQQQVATKLVLPPREVGSRSTPVPARDHSGRFIRGGSRLEEVDPTPVKLKEAVVVQDVAEGVLDEEVADSAEDGGSFEEGNEVCGHDLEGTGSDSSSAESDYVIEEVGKSMDQQGMCSSQSGKIGDSVAQQVFAVMPHSDQVAAGGNLGIDSSARVSEKGVGGVPKAPWVNLFKDNRNLGMGIKLDEWEDDGDLVLLEEDDVDVVEDAWGYCLVGLFAGKFPGWTAVRKLREGWKVDCTHWRHRSGWLVFKFQSEEDRRKVLEGGPYFAYGSNLILKSLPRCFRFEGEDVSSVPIWIKLPGLPLDCWNARALGKIVSKVGKPISTDKLTLSKERISFARVLVEVDASEDIISEVEVRLPTGEVYQQLVIPELIPKFCKRCKTFGHMEGGCGKGSEGKNSKVFENKMSRMGGGGPLDGVSGIRTGGGAVNCSGANKEDSGPLDDVPHIQMTPAAGSGDCGVDLVPGTVAAGPVHLLDDHAPERIQAWLLSGPKEVRVAAAVPMKDRVDAVFSALPLALGVAGVFTRAARPVAGNSDEVQAGGSLASDLPGPAVMASDPALVDGSLQVGVVQGTVQVGSSVEGSSLGLGPSPAVGLAADAGKGKQLLLSGQQGTAAVHQQSAGGGPHVGLGEASGGWKVVGKKKGNRHR